MKYLSQWNGYLTSYLNSEESVQNKAKQKTPRLGKQATYQPVQGFNDIVIKQNKSVVILMKAVM